MDDAVLGRILAGVDLFPFNSLVCITEKLAEALAWLDFGEGGLTETPVYASDGSTLLPRPLFLMEYPNHKDTILRDITPRCRPLYPSRPDSKWELPANLTGRDVFVSAGAAAGPDFWLDPMISLCWFASDRAARTLIDLGFEAPFRLNQCKFPAPGTLTPT